MKNLIFYELLKIATKPRSYIGFIAITAIVLLIQIAMYIDGDSYISFFTQSLEQSFSIEGKFLNGNLICFIILQTLIIQMPLLVALVTGDTISGEAAQGTLRLLLTKPYSRAKILWAKIIAGSGYLTLLLLWLGVLALGLGLLIFGKGDLVVLKTEQIVILRENDILWRFLLAFLIAFLSLQVVASLSLLLSCFTDNSIGPIIISMAIIILFTIIGTLDIPLFDTIKFFLFTTHMIVWRNLFDNPLDLQLIFTSVGILIAHIVLFNLFAFYFFKRKDIQS